MINIDRNSYLIRTNAAKTNNCALSAQDYLDIGYMAGRFGVNLNSNPHESNPIIKTKDGLIVNINSCTSDLFEKNLTQSGIKFDRLV